MTQVWHDPCSRSADESEGLPVCVVSPRRCPAADWCTSRGTGFTFGEPEPLVRPQGQRGPPVALQEI